MRSASNPLGITKVASLISAFLIRDTANFAIHALEEELRYRTRAGTPIGFAGVFQAAG